jgi:uncharacterized MAPEG superfamily protein
MSVSIYCLVGWCAWAILLVLAVATVRVTQVLRGTKRANEFPSGMQHGGDAYWRLNRAHINTVENLPIFGALVLAAVWVRVDVALPCELALAARLVQSLAHISSGTAMAVNVRFTAFATQLGGFVVMIVRLLRAG